MVKAFFRSGTLTTLVSIYLFAICICASLMWGGGLWLILPVHQNLLAAGAGAGRGGCGGGSDSGESSISKGISQLSASS